MNLNGGGIQVDKGEFVRIHNTILEKLAQAPLRGQQFRCLFFLFRKTYGYNKKEEKISLKAWADGTNLIRQNVWRELQLLLKCKVIYMKSSGVKQSNVYGFNKYFEEWNFESVITDDYKSVITDDYSLSESVITNSESVIMDDYKSVITPSHTRDLKDSKDNRSTSKTTATDDALALVNLIQANGFMYLERGALAIALQLIESYGWERCVSAVDKLVAAHQKLITGGKRGITSPLAYLRTIVADQVDAKIVSDKGFVPDAWAQLLCNDMKED